MLFAVQHGQNKEAVGKGGLTRAVARPRTPVNDRGTMFGHCLTESFRGEPARGSAGGFVLIALFRR
ncbi:hypothetical protein CK231_18915 [Mesorhizobium loti]|uniref:Uncharacterized protein n=1 Tax=Rhizobium loti TaxID=381 RepID=A0A1A5J0W1_RHILI|nr:hypothetical protein BAE42_23955 [Mesorhizobium loti]QGX77750.1 hypothetical protein EB234_13205 [Mesorhizobium japonicum R7A]OBP70543.1 hypothetical protein BAE39_23395 [Mesorhizobium loti]OBP84657.1 hypothetical protein BAE38_24745 [Mesorhizobium loti]OBP87150.1 hypothetical protein BAE41_26140 [Mesorhizobium loti]